MKIACIIALFLSVGFSVLNSTGASGSNTAAAPVESIQQKLKANSKALEDHEARVKKLELSNQKHEKQLTAIVANQPRSFFGKDLSGRSITGQLTELDSLSFASKARPVGFFLMPANTLGADVTKHDKFGSLHNTYAGGSGAAFRVVRTHNNTRTVVASVSWLEHHGGTKTFSAGQFLGIDNSPVVGKVNYSVEMQAVSGSVLITNARFAAIEMPFAD